MANIIDQGKALYEKYGPQVTAAYDGWRNAGSPQPSAAPFTPPAAPIAVPPTVEPERTFSVGMGTLLAAGGIAAVLGYLFSSSKRRK